MGFYSTAPVYTTYEHVQFLSTLNLPVPEILSFPTSGMMIYLTDKTN